MMGIVINLVTNLLKKRNNAFTLYEYDYYIILNKSILLTTLEHEKWENPQDIFYYCFILKYSQYHYVNAVLSLSTDYYWLA